ncbi:hypothetical protein [Zooshikella sp. RANM57]|uniref:hypothetical protein n=1 Tax=Zooshikella sp. RANM57 TaxID=3425863 RepID=UPI003D6FDC8C
MISTLFPISEFPHLVNYPQTLSPLCNSGFLLFSGLALLGITALSIAITKQ